MLQDVDPQDAVEEAVWEIELLLAIAGSPPRSLRAQGQNTLQYAEPADVGMSPAILESGVQLFRDAVERGDLAGAVLLVAKDGKVVLHEALGWRNAQRRLPMERNTMFRMASNTKPVVATAISMLVQRRKLEYEAPCAGTSPPSTIIALASYRFVIC